MTILRASAALMLALGVTFISLACGDDGALAGTLSPPPLSPTAVPPIESSQEPTSTTIASPTPGETVAPTVTVTLTTTAPPQTPTPDPGNARVRLQEIASGLDAPVYVTQAPGDGERLFVVEQGGRIRGVRDGHVSPLPFLDISDRVETSGAEQGLLGLAFHPQFPDNGRLFVAYTAAGDGANTVAEYHVPPDADAADPGSARVLLAVEDFADNHNGGMLAFGADGYLYISTGDGGGGGDPEGNGQRLDVLLGKILRIDADRGDPYGIPVDNPFAGDSGARPEIWAYGLRNPWRFGFDRATGDLWIGDVGQGDWEEIDRQPAGIGGQNYGWDTYEGTHCFEDDRGCGRLAFAEPVFEYDHNAGCSVTGGYVYRGSRSPALTGLYLFSDYCSGTIWALSQASDGRWGSTELLQPSGRVTSFGEDNAGELYITDDQNGAVYRIVAE